MTEGGTWALVSLVALLAACSAQPPIEVSRELIVAGEESGPEQDGVLLIRTLADDDKNPLCSASLVAPNLLLTAQHCVSYVSNGLFSCNTRGELTNNEDGGGQLGLSLPPEKIEVYDGARPRQAPVARGAQIISTHSTNVCQNDIAFVVLDTSLDLPIIPMRLGRSAAVGELGVLVGYGMDAGQQFIDYRVQPRNQKRDQEVRGVGPDTLEDGVTTLPPRTLRLEGPSGCIGDSGGPLLSQVTGAVLGVYSLQASVACASPDAVHQLVHVPPFQLLVEDAFEAAGATPRLEEEPEPTGASGAAGAGGAEAEPRGGEGGEAPEEAPTRRSSSGCAATSGAPSGAWPWLLLALAIRRRR